MNTTDQMREATRRYWDEEAPTFDLEPDHGLADPDTRAAWRTLLVRQLPAPPARVLDVGCGTGSLSLLLAEQGYAVTGIDLSPAMIEQARSKLTLAGYSVPFRVGDAADPQLPFEKFDAIVCRHLLWTLPHPDRVLHRWRQLLAPGGCLVLVEGFWQTGGGLHASELTEMLPPLFTDVTPESLSENQLLWGKAVHDERYIITARRT